MNPPALMQTERAAHAAVRYPDGRVLVIAGYNGAYLSSTEVYEPGNNRWSSGPTLPVAATGMALVLAPNGSAYAFGGQSSTGILSSVYRLSSLTGTWQSAPAMPRPRAAAFAVAMGTRILVGGGFESTTSMPTSRVDIFDTSTGGWTSAPSMQIARRGAQGALLSDGRVMVFGGDVGLGQPISSTEIFDDLRQEWSVGPAMPQPGSFHGLTAASDGRIYLAGGSAPDPVSTVWAYDPRLQSFATITAMPQALTSGCLVESPNGRLLMIGGFHPSIGRSRRVYGFALGGSQWQ